MYGTRILAGNISQTSPSLKSAFCLRACGLLPTMSVKSENFHTVTVCFSLEYYMIC